ncbi:MAG: type I-E CRISPR-associated protein Cas7/Cse4/CasC [Gammaproteobacteria bacterium]
MSRFVQLHILTAYPPSNPNRDDLGRPKTAMIGNAMRQRISSQAIKRAIRTSDVFATALKGAIGERTQRLGEEIEAYLAAKDVDEARRVDISRHVASAFGKLKGDKDDNPTRIEQLAFISPEEKAFALELADRLVAGEDLPKEKELGKIALRRADGAADIAMFGRMLADNPDFNREAAVQVSHAFTTNRSASESDYYTAVDDLKRPSEDAGAGFIGEAGFGAGVFYLYVCVDRALLIENLAGDRALAARAIEALVRATALASPIGKRNSFANHVRAEFVLAERGDGQPRSLASAFTVPVEDEDLLTQSRHKLLQQRARFGAVYGQDWDADRVLDVHAEGTATLDEVAHFSAESLPAAVQ